jgi:hypothetical protein
MKGIIPWIKKLNLKEKVHPNDELLFEIKISFERKLSSH